MWTPRENSSSWDSLLLPSDIMCPWQHVHSYTSKHAYTSPKHTHMNAHTSLHTYTHECIHNGYIFKTKQWLGGIWFLGAQPETPERGLLIKGLHLLKNKPPLTATKSVPFQGLQITCFRWEHRLRSVFISLTRSRRYYADMATWLRNNSQLLWIHNLCMWIQEMGNYDQLKIIIIWLNKMILNCFFGKKEPSPSRSLFPPKKSQTKNPGYKNLVKATYLKKIKNGSFGLSSHL